MGRRDSAGGELCLRFTFGVQGLGLCKTPEMAELNRLHIIMEVGWKIIFHSKWVICRFQFQPLIFQGVNQFFLVGFQIPMMCNGWTRRRLEDHHGIQFHNYLPVGKMTFSIPRGSVCSLEGIDYLQLSVTSVGIKEFSKIS